VERDVGSAEGVDDEPFDVGDAEDGAGAGAPWVGAVGVVERDAVESFLPAHT
jgi:hypothetical protein